MRNYLLTALLLLSAAASAQVGEYRSQLAVGGSAGVCLASVGFSPVVVQGMKPGLTAGLTARYTCEKYFRMLCAIQTELNYVEGGWKQTIEDARRAPVVNPATGQPEAYSRTLRYVQVPVLGRLAWGREHKGAAFYVVFGPQVGFLIGESTTCNYDPATRNLADRASQIVAQEDMPAEHTIDYGITAGGGVEYTLPRLGHFMLEGRYYYGLGNIYGNSKRDYFGASNNTQIVVKLSYLFDIAGHKEAR